MLNCGQSAVRVLLVITNALIECFCHQKVMRDISDSLLHVLIATVSVSEYLQFLQMLRLKFY